MAKRVGRGDGYFEIVRDRLARASGEITVNQLAEDQFEARLESVVGGLPQFKIQKRSRGSMSLKRRVNWATWGEVIELSWYPTAAGMHLDAKVRPSLPTTIHDWGQGKRDIQAIFQAL